MKIFPRRMAIIFLIAMTSTVLLHCSRPKKGKVAIVSQKFSIRQDTKISWEVDAKGKVKNVGDAPVKNVVVTGYCKSCGEVFTNREWYVSNYEKMPDQKAVIKYLPPGGEADFSFTGVAFMPDQSGKGPDKLPDALECKVVSFETADNR